MLSAIHSARAGFGASALSIRALRGLCASALAAALALLGACGGGSDNPGRQQAGDAGAAAMAGWTQEADILGACCYYATLLIDEQKNLRIYTNSGANEQIGDLYLYEGGFDGVSGGRSVLSVPDARDRYVRTSAIVRREGKYYALLYTGDGYPTSGGYSPSWATSPDGVNWTWRGFVSPYGRNLSSGQAMTVDEQGNFRAWIDSVGGKMREMRSSDGIQWKDMGDMWPAQLASTPGPVFPNAVRTPKGTMLTVGNAWPTTETIVLWQCHGKTDWQVLETKSQIRAGVKGVALAWDGKRIHSYSLGKHFTRDEPACPS